MGRKLRWDLRVASGRELGEESHHLSRHQVLHRSRCAEQPIRTRLYFAHHSQLQTLVNLFRWAPMKRQFISEQGEQLLAEMPLPLGYICHLIIKLFQGDTVMLELSPGDKGSSADGVVAPSMVIGNNISLDDLDAFLTEALVDARENCAGG